jgi:hypothetical protein
LHVVDQVPELLIGRADPANSEVSWWVTQGFSCDCGLMAFPVTVGRCGSTREASEIEELVSVLTGRGFVPRQSTR